MKKHTTLVFCCLLSVIWAAMIFLLPEIQVGFIFGNGVGKVSVEHIVDSSGGFHIKVQPKEAAAKIEYMTIAGIPVFSKEWLVYNVSSTVPLGESEVVNFPRFFGLLSKLFKLARYLLAFVPVSIILLWCMARSLFPLLKQRCGRRGFTVFLVLSALLALPAPIVDFEPGLDPSWSWLLCRHAFQNVFGSETVFTYGPLGFLLAPQASLGCAISALILNFVFVAVWIVLLMRIYNDSNAGRGAAWLLIATTVIPITMEWRWISLVVASVAAPLFLQKERVRYDEIHWAIAGGLSAMVCMMKFSSLTIVLGSHVFIFTAMILKRKNEVIRRILIYGLSFVFVFLTISIVCFASVSAWGNWVRGSIATASGYNLYMVVEKPWIELMIPALVFMLFWRGAGWRNCILFMPIFFLTAKYAWVRQSALPMIYISSVLMAICYIRRIRHVRWCFSLIVFALILNVAPKLPWAMSGLSSLPPIIGLNPCSLINSLILPVEVEQSLVRSMKAVEVIKMPQNWRERIGGGSVAFMPYEHGFAMADETIKIKLLPSVQLYSACHPVLDELNADFFRNQIPDFVICEVNAPWSGWFIGYPRTWKAFLENYGFTGEEYGKYLLMSKRENPRKAEGKSVICPDELSFADKAVGIFFRRNVEYMTLVSNEGNTMRCQFIRGNQGVPFPLEWMPFDEEDIRAILKGGKGRVKSVVVGKEINE